MSRVLVSVLAPLFPGACSSDSDTERTPAWTPVSWSSENPELDASIGGTALSAQRGIIHLHSPWSHDACDGDPLPDGSPDLDCLQDLRAGLCTTRMDFAYLTDHPDYSAWQEWDELFMAQPGDELLTHTDGQPVALQVRCDDHQSDHQVLLLPGNEDELMPLGLEQPVAETAEERHRLLNQADSEAIQASLDAGGSVFLAHTEGRTLKETRQLVQAGVSGVEIFNLHAMFDPDIRSEDLGLEPASWLGEVSPFTDSAGSAEPDLLFLAVHAQQDPSIAIWDALQSDGPVIGVGGTDAHQNVLDLALRDGERMDSYRRMMRWFSNVLLVDPGLESPEAQDEALESGRVFVVFEILGMPENLDFYMSDSSGARREMGSTGEGGELVISCPTLSPLSPQSQPDHEVLTRVYLDGQVWANECGTFEVQEAGSYRVRYEIIPTHLTGFLGDDPAPWMQSYPWVYSNPIHVSH